MKNFISIVIILFALFFAGYNVVYAGPCKRPLEYAIGSVDPKFGVSDAEFLADIRKGEALWEKAAGKNLFDFKPGAKFKVNLVYDERQRLVLQKQRTESGLEAIESTFRTADARFLSMKSRYESKVAEHDRAVAEFQQEQAQYEAQVRQWNGRGGAPKGEFEKLEQQRISLNSQVASLNSETNQLNAMSAELNTLLQGRNRAAQDYNELIKTYNDKYGSGLEFDQAEFKSSPPTINVYEFKSAQDLTLALTHELGHALGLDHVDNPKSVMYYMTGGQTLSLSSEDVAELKSVCRIK